MRAIKTLFLQSWRFLRWAVVVFAGYLLQMCVVPYLEIGDVAPNLLFALIGVITVCYGRLRAYWTGAIYGILLETMMPSITMLSLAFYPIASSLASVGFADKSEKRLEAERSMNKSARNGNVYLRSVGCAGVLSLLNEIINVVYIYLGGTAIEALHIRRALLGLFGTMALTALIAWPVRHLLGFRHAPREEKETKGRYLL